MLKKREVCRHWNNSFIIPAEGIQFKKISEVEDRTSLLVQRVDPSEFPGEKKSGCLLTM